MPANFHRGILPHAPLTFSDDTTVQPAAVPGAPLLCELEGEDALAGWNVVRGLLLHAGGSDPAEFHSARALERWETELLVASERNAFLSPLAVIVGGMRQGGDAGRARICEACLAVADRALERGAPGSALCFVEAAALCWPENARYAMVAGRAFKTHGRLREADRWLRRAMKLSRWTEDWLTHVLSTSSYGMLCWTQGVPARARRHLLRARHLAHRHHLPVIEGEVLHNLFVLCITTADHEQAPQYARGALERYLPDHPRLPALAYDAAYYWMTRGQPRRTLPVFQHLLDRFDNDTQRLQVLAATVRAAGACGERNAFEESWSAAFRLLDRVPSNPVMPAILMDLGFGAAHADEWDRAGAVFSAALWRAQELGLPKEAVSAEACADAAAKRRNPDASIRLLGTERPGRALLDDFVLALTEIPEE